MFILPGVALAGVLRGVGTPNLAYSATVGLIAAVGIASANYVINEYLDREFDRHHPTKSARRAVQSDVSGRLVALQWLVLVSIGLIAAAAGGTAMFLVGIGFALQGIFYNVRPFRTKEVAYLDVLSEAVNNSFRLMIGWAIVSPTTLPPTSLILAFWFGGAFLMAAKRMSEYREICATHGKDLLVRYRGSFAGYTEAGLMASCFAYALLSTTLVAVFLIKYRIEYLLCLPLMIWLFSQYLVLSMRPGSVAQAPERLFRETRLMITSGVLAGLFMLLTFVDVPVLDQLIEQKFIVLG